MISRAGRLVAPAVLLAALLACRGGIEQADRDARRAGCAKDPSFDPAASERAFEALRGAACAGSRCADWWDYVVTTCVFKDEVFTDGRQRVEVHTPLSAETDTAREKREAMCDAVRERISMTDRATVHNARGNAMTTCGKPRTKR